MARPKRIAGEKTAYERMEDVFWSMLAEMPYHAMTAREVCGRAGVSHNAFYYHFDNMDDMAQQLFWRAALPEAPKMLLDFMSKGESPTGIVADIADFEQRAMKMGLIARSGSPLLIGLLHDAVVSAWLEAVGMEESGLTLEDRIDITFAVGGMIALLGSDFAFENVAMAPTFLEREIGQGILAKMKRLSEQESCDNGLVAS